MIHAKLTDILRTATREKRTAETIPLRDDDAWFEPTRQLRDIVDLLPGLTQRERDAIAASLNGTYRSCDRAQENALYSARKKLKSSMREGDNNA